MTEERRHFRIFISSPGDVAEERQIARDLVKSDSVQTALQEVRHVRGSKLGRPRFRYSDAW